MTNPVQFMRQVRSEVSKVTWPTRQEAIMSTIMVVILSLIASLFFFGVDTFFAWVVRLLLV